MSPGSSGPRSGIGARQDGVRPWSPAALKGVTQSNSGNACRRLVRGLPERASLLAGSQVVAPRLGLGRGSMWLRDGTRTSPCGAPAVLLWPCKLK